MNTRNPKTLKDLPQFAVTSLRRGPTADAGYTHFEIEGSFDRVIEIAGLQWFWLLYGKGGYICASVQSLNKETKAAVLTFEAREEPEIMGRALAYLSSRWQAVNVWMVLDPNWGWEKKQFVAADAIAEDFESKDVSIVDGREVKVWTKLTRIGTQRRSSRYHPSGGETAMQIGDGRVVREGWDHEHCELCNSHIDAQMFGYCDSDGRWMCEKCHERYVINRDLAFVDEL